MRRDLLLFLVIVTFSTVSCAGEKPHEVQSRIDDLMITDSRITGTYQNITFNAAYNDYSAQEVFVWSVERNPAEYGTDSFAFASLSEDDDFSPTGEYGTPDKLYFDPFGTELSCRIYEGIYSLSADDYDKYAYYSVSYWTDGTVVLFDAPGNHNELYLPYENSVDTMNSFSYSPTNSSAYDAIACQLSDFGFDPISNCHSYQLFTDNIENSFSV